MDTGGFLLIATFVVALVMGNVRQFSDPPDTGDLVFHAAMAILMTVSTVYWLVLPAIGIIF